MYTSALSAYALCAGFSDDVRTHRCASQQGQARYRARLRERVRREEGSSRALYIIVIMLGIGVGSYLQRARACGHCFFCFLFDHRVRFEPVPARPVRGYLCVSIRSARGPLA